MSSRTSLGEEPGDLTETVTLRRSISGKFWTGRLEPAIRPPTMKNSIRRFAATGLPAKYAISPFFTVITGFPLSTGC